MIASFGKQRSLLFSSQPLVILSPFFVLATFVAATDTMRSRPAVGALLSTSVILTIIALMVPLALAQNVLYVDTSLVPSTATSFACDSRQSPCPSLSVAQANIAGSG